MNDLLNFRYYPPGSGVPWATIIGSANLGERSVRRDLEAQALIFTVSPDLQVTHLLFCITSNIDVFYRAKLFK